MVGEIRDMETAEIAIQAALTGHLVLSHPAHQRRRRRRHPPGDMGVEPFLVASSLRRRASPSAWCARSARTARSPTRSRASRFCRARHPPGTTGTLHALARPRLHRTATTPATTAAPASSRPLVTTTRCARLVQGASPAEEIKQRRRHLGMRHLARRAGEGRCGAYDHRTGGCGLASRDVGRRGRLQGLYRRFQDVKNTTRLCDSVAARGVGCARADLRRCSGRGGYAVTQSAWYQLGNHTLVAGEGWSRPKCPCPRREQPSGL